MESMTVQRLARLAALAALAWLAAGCASFAGSSAGTQGPTAAAPVHFVCRGGSASRILSRQGAGQTCRPTALLDIGLVPASTPQRAH